MKEPQRLLGRLATVHLGLGVLCVLLGLPYLFSAGHSWWQAQQFGGFAAYADVLHEAARAALVKGLVAALGAAYFLSRWWVLRAGRKAG